MRKKEALKMTLIFAFIAFVRKHLHMKLVLLLYYLGGPMTQADSCINSSNYRCAATANAPPLTETINYHTPSNHRLITATNI